MPSPLHQKSRRTFSPFPGFLRKQFIAPAPARSRRRLYVGEPGGGRAVLSGEWLAGIRARYGTEPKITYFETVALTDKASGQASGLD